MVDGSYSQFKATKGRKEDRDFKKKGRFDKKNHQFDSNSAGTSSRHKIFSDEEIEITKSRMREKRRKDKRRERNIIFLTLILIAIAFVIIRMV